MFSSMSKDVTIYKKKTLFSQNNDPTFVNNKFDAHSQKLPN